MKKIIFLMLIMGVFSPLINAWNLIIQDYKSTTQTSEMYYFDVNVNQIKFQRLYNGQGSNSGVSPNGTYFWSGLSNVKSYGGSQGYRTIQQINNDFKNDIEILDSFYRNAIQLTLNWFYNPNSFSYNNHIEYTNYQILYDENGLAVESIVGGIWAGLYSDSQKSKSGALYNKNGSMVYYNGKEVTPVVSFLVWFQKFTNRVVLDVFEEIRKSIVTGIILSVVLVLGLVRLVLELLPSSIMPRRRYYRGAGGSLSDYGDGSQVAASVRARLAAKNRALKARANGGADGGDAVKQSLVNGILFDLENDR